jgi:hypothetical protein
MPPAFFHRGQDRIVRLLEEHDCLQLAHQARIQHEKVDVRPAALRALGSHRLEQINPAGVGRGASPAEKVGVVVAPVGTGLPDFEHHVVECAAVGLRHAASDLDALARRRLAVHRGQVVRALRELAREERPERHFARGHESRHGMAGAARRPRTTS